MTAGKSSGRRAANICGDPPSLARNEQFQCAMMLDVEA
jgi:hypothetical protein